MDDHENGGSCDKQELRRCNGVVGGTCSVEGVIGDDIGIDGAIMVEAVEYNWGMADTISMSGRRFYRILLRFVTIVKICWVPWKMKLYKINKFDQIQQKSNLVKVIGN